MLFLLKASLFAIVLLAVNANFSNFSNLSNFSNETAETAIVEDSGVGIGTFEETVPQPQWWRRLAQGSNFADADRIALLNLHNDYRRSVAQGKVAGQPGARYMEELSWDTALEQVATAHTANCLWEGNPKSHGFGENRYFRYTSGTPSGSIRVLGGGLARWFKQHAFYTHSDNTCRSGHSCGTYKQMMFDETRYVGCGYTICDTLRDRRGRTWKKATFMVCNYLVGRTGRAPYAAATLAKPACSACPIGRKTCSGKLCSDGKGQGALTTTTTTAMPVATVPAPVPPTPSKKPGSCTGIWFTVGINFRAPSATCAQYEAALLEYKPCISSITTCKVRAWPQKKYAGWYKVTLKFPTSWAEYRKYSSRTWGAGMKKNLIKMGVQFV